jgi:hypothetical protein
LLTWCLTASPVSCSSRLSGCFCKQLGYALFSLSHCLRLLFPSPSSNGCVSAVHCMAERGTERNYLHPARWLIAQCCTALLYLQGSGCKAWLTRSPSAASSGVHSSPQAPLRSRSSPCAVLSLNHAAAHLQEWPQHPRPRADTGRMGRLLHATSAEAPSLPPACLASATWSMPA